MPAAGDPPAALVSPPAALALQRSGSNLWLHSSHGQCTFVALNTTSAFITPFLSWRLEVAAIQTKSLRVSPARLRYFVSPKGTRLRVSPAQTLLQRSIRALALTQSPVEGNPPAALDSAPTRTNGKGGH
jgi:hypothetical protein